MRNAIILLASAFSLWSCSVDTDVQLAPDAFSLEDVLKIPDSLAYVFQSEYFNEDAQLKLLGSDEQLVLNDLVFDNKVIGYISDVQCDSCVDQEIEFLKEFYEKDDIILFCNYSSERALKLYLKMNKIDIPAYSIISSPSDLLVRFPFPTYFKLNSNYKPSSVFFASVSTPNRSKSYHKLMARLSE